MRFIFAIPLMTLPYRRATKQRSSLLFAGLIRRGYEFYVTALAAVPAVAVSGLMKFAVNNHQLPCMDLSRKPAASAKRFTVERD